MEVRTTVKSGIFGTLSLQVVVRTADIAVRAFLSPRLFRVRNLFRRFLPKQVAPAPLNIRLGVTALEDRTVPASWMIYLNSIFKEETKTVPNFSGTMPRKWGYQGITHKNFECLVP